MGRALRLGAGSGTGQSISVSINTHFWSPPPETPTAKARDLLVEGPAISPRNHNEVEVAATNSEHRMERVNGDDAKSSVFRFLKDCHPLTLDYSTAMVTILEQVPVCNFVPA